MFSSLGGQIKGQTWFLKGFQALIKSVIKSKGFLEESRASGNPEDYEIYLVIIDIKTCLPLQLYNK